VADAITCGKNRLLDEYFVTGFRLFQITRFIPAAVPVLKGKANDKWY